MLALATAMQLSVSLPQQTPAAIGPLLTHDLGLSRTELGLLTSAIWGGMLLGMLPWGVFSDRWGERWGVLAGGLMLSGCLLVAAQTRSFLPLFLTLMVAAVGAASGSPGGTRAIAAWFAPARRGMAMGIRQTGVTAAGVIAALTLPPIAVRWGWQAAFRTVAVLVLLGAGLFAACYREPERSRRARRGTFRVLELASNHAWLAATLFSFVFMGAQSCAITYLVVSLHDDAGLSVVGAGSVLATLQVGGIAGRLGWGILSDRIGSRGRVLAMAGSLGVASSLATAAAFHPGTPIPLLVVVAVALGASCLGWNAVYITLTSEAVPEGYAATAVGAGSTITFIGMFVAAPVFGLIADATHRYTWSWLALALWALGGTLVALFIRDGRSHPLPGRVGESLAEHC